MRRYDLISSIVLLIWGVLITIGAFRLPIGIFENPDSGFLPLLTGITLSILSSCLFIRCFLQSPSEREKPFWGEKARGDKVINTLLGLLAYAIALELLGFLSVTLLLMFFLLKIIGSLSWRPSLVGAILIAFSAYVLFKLFLQVQLPVGPWGI